jgi:hypothetical protein
MNPPAAKPRYILSDNRVRFVSCGVYKKRSGLRRSGGDDSVSYPALKRRATPISPFQGYGDGSPSFTGRCPVLLIAGLSALHCSVETQCIASLHARRNVNAMPSVNHHPEGCRRDGARPVSTRPTCIGQTPIAIDKASLCSKAGALLLARRSLETTPSGSGERIQDFQPRFAQLLVLNS